uniref:Uncharacterized protein n=1 Tax=Helianthus annuus TaxID=4232 RepID=A0A251SEL3_HELAN
MCLLLSLVDFYWSKDGSSFDDRTLGLHFSWYFAANNKFILKLAYKCGVDSWF